VGSAREISSRAPICRSPAAGRIPPSTNDPLTVVNASRRPAPVALLALWGPDRDSWSPRIARAQAGQPACWKSQIRQRARALEKSVRKKQNKKDNHDAVPLRGRADNKNHPLRGIYRSFRLKTSVEPFPAGDTARSRIEGLARPRARSPSLEHTKNQLNDGIDPPARSCDGDRPAGGSNPAAPDWCRQGFPLPLNRATRAARGCWSSGSRKNALFPRLQFLRALVALVLSPSLLNSIRNIKDRSYILCRSMDHQGRLMLVTAGFPPGQPMRHA